MFFSTTASSCDGFVSQIHFLQFFPGQGRRKFRSQAWRKALVPHVAQLQFCFRDVLAPILSCSLQDVSIYKQNLSQKESFNFGSMQELGFFQRPLTLHQLVGSCRREDLEILLQCIKGCPSPVLLAAAAAAALAILALWRMQGKNGPEVHELQKELSQAKPGQSAEDLCLVPSTCDGRLPPKTR